MLASLLKPIGLIAPKDLYSTVLSLEMPVPSQGHYGFHSFPVVD